LAKRGYDLLLIARRRDRLAAAAQQIETAWGVKVRTVVADLSKPADLDTVATAISSDETVTMLVNNAGQSTLAPLSKTTGIQMTAMININIVALTTLTLAVLTGFKERNHGTIVNIGSILGFAALPNSSIYSGTKAFVTFLTRGLHDEFAGTQIRIQLVAPAATATDIWELSGVPLSNLDPATVMSAEACVDAALAGLDRGEAVTFPSVGDSGLLHAFDVARRALLSGAQTGETAQRYRPE
jgi:short-subunit dehydrogenase